MNMACLYRVYYLPKEDVCQIRPSSYEIGAENHTASVPEVRSELKVNLRRVLVVFCVLLVAAPIFFIYYGVTTDRKEQELEELRIANYNLTSNNSALLAAHAILQSQYERNNSYLQKSRDTLQSQYAALNKKHEELANEFSKLQEYYCDVTNTSRENTCPLCKVGWIPFGSKCYFISTKTLTWNESRDWCLTKGGQLVNIESLAERDFLKSKAFIIGAKETHYWIGQYDFSKEEKTTRMASEPLKSNRASDDYKENCLLTRLESNQDYRVWCETLNRWICESAAFPLHI